MPQDDQKEFDELEGERAQIAKRLEQDFQRLIQQLRERTCNNAILAQVLERIEQSKQTKIYAKLLFEEGEESSPGLKGAIQETTLEISDERAWALRSIQECVEQCTGDCNKLADLLIEKVQRALQAEKVTEEPENACLVMTLQALSTVVFKKIV